MFMLRFQLSLAAAGLALGFGLPAVAAPVQFVRARIPATAPTYKLVDIGHPPYYNWGPPVAFNNTGQIVGYVNIGSYGFVTGTRCVVYTGSAYINLSPALDNTCLATGVSDSVSNSYTVAGSLQDDISPDNRQAFVSTVTGSTAKIDVFGNFPQSELNAITANGKFALGSSAYAPPLGYFSSGGPFYFQPGTGVTSLVPMQAQCYTVKQYCMASAVSGGGPLSVAARSINASGTVLGYDQSVGGGAGIMEYSIGDLKSGVDFPKLQASGAPQLTALVGLDDAGNIYTQVNDPTSGHKRSLIFSRSTAKYVSTGARFGAACDYYPLTVNGPGDIVGYAACPVNNTTTYYEYEWTPAAGMVELFQWNYDANPPYQAEAINDNGDVLVAISTNNSQGPDWGEFVSSTSPSKVGR